MRNILVIDDDRELCDLLQKYFSMEDFGLDYANEGEAGLGMLAGGGVRLMAPWGEEISLSCLLSN